MYSPIKTFSNTRLVQSGFTMLETMVAMAIIVIIMAISFSDTSFIQNERKVNVSGQLLEDTLDFARRYALSTGLKVGVCPVASSASTGCASGTDWSNGWAVFSYETSGSNLATKFIRYIEPKENVTVTASSSTPLTINGLGVTGNQSQFTIVDVKGSNTLTLSVSRAMNIERA